MAVKIKWAKTRENAIVPSKRPEDAGYDIYACLETGLTIPAHGTVLIPTGIACAIEPGYYFQVEERGSTGKAGLKKSAGVIDSGYRDEIFIAIYNANNKPVAIGEDNYLKRFPETPRRLAYNTKKAIAQLVLHEVPEVEAEEISYDELKTMPSERGTGKLGSSGK